MQEETTGLPYEQEPHASQESTTEGGAATKAAPTRPRIGDTRPAPPVAAPSPDGQRASAPVGPVKPRIGDTRPAPPSPNPQVAKAEPSAGTRRRRRRGGRGRSPKKPTGPLTQVVTAPEEVLEALDQEVSGTRQRALGRYLMCIHVERGITQVAVLEGRELIEHYVGRDSDQVSQIDGNIYVGRVKNVLPGMEAAFIDIGTPKNAVLYWGDVRYDPEDIEEGSKNGKPRIEQVLKAGQEILCQVVKNPIGAKGARLTQEVSLPGRFVVLVPGGSLIGISKRLDDKERRRLRRIVDDFRGLGHGIILRTAAAGVSAEDLKADINRLVSLWEQIEAASKAKNAPALLYTEPGTAVRVLREELSTDYRAVLIDDRKVYDEVRGYVAAVSPELAERIEFYDTSKEPLALFDRYHVHEQLHKALDRKVWLPSGGSLIIERTEALTVIDVNTGKNVGKTNLEETVTRNNIEAAEEIARQLRLRDIGGIIVIDFIDMELKTNRDKVEEAFRAALARDKTRTQFFSISELGLVEMTRKRVSEGLVEAFSETCPTCGGRGIVFDEELLH
jgi:ribonuclease E